MAAIPSTSNSCTNSTLLRLLLAELLQLAFNLFFVLTHFVQLQPSRVEKYNSQIFQALHEVVKLGIRWLSSSWHSSQHPQPQSLKHSIYTLACFEMLLEEMKADRKTNQLFCFVPPTSFPTCIPAVLAAIYFSWFCS